MKNLTRLWGQLVNYWLRSVTDVVRKLRGWDTTEDWLAYAIRHSKLHGLDREVVDEFWSNLKSGHHPSVAAECALWDWDI